MAESASQRLKVYTEETPEVARPEIEGVASLPAVLQGFRQATGWSLAFVPGPQPPPSADLTWSAPVNPGVGVTPGHLRLAPAAGHGAAKRAPAKAESAQGLAASLGDMLSELLRTQHVLWHREAELAAGVPVLPHPNEKQHLAARLQAVLQGGAEGVNADAAALYLLDEATTSLKLRSVWGFPLSRLTEPARPLQGATADLEALLGHAVVLEDAALMHTWNAPEREFGAAVCVPVSTPTTILGTLWVYARARRDFSPRETNIIEIAAGRVASDLEREMLLREGVTALAMKRQLAEAQRWQRNQLPAVAPLVEGWEMAGWTEQAGAVGGDFYDWFCLDQDRLGLVVGDSSADGVEAAMSAAALKTAVRCFARSCKAPARLLEQTNLTVWTGSAGDQFASLFFGRLDPASGWLRYSTAGKPSVVLLRAGKWKKLGDPTPGLGEGPETVYREHRRRLEPGEALLVFTDGVRDALDHRGRPLGEAGLAEPLCRQADQGAERLAALAGDRLAAHATTPERYDRTVLVVKRRAP